MSNQKQRGKKRWKQEQQSKPIATHRFPPKANGEEEHICHLRLRTHKTNPRKPFVFSTAEVEGELNLMRGHVCLLPCICSSTVSSSTAHLTYNNSPSFLCNYRNLITLNAWSGNMARQNLHGWWKERERMLWGKNLHGIGSERAVIWVVVLGRPVMGDSVSNLYSLDMDFKLIWLTILSQSKFFIRKIDQETCVRMLNREKNCP